MVLKVIRILVKIPYCFSVNKQTNMASEKAPDMKDNIAKTETVTDMKGNIVKMEVDYSETCEKKIPECEEMATVRYRPSKFLQNPF